MNYKKIYNNIIESRINNIPDGYKEKHHILPKSIGGNNDSTNLVYLTAREHFVCHYLLTKIYKHKSFEWYKMNHAFMMMGLSSKNQLRYYNSRLYESKRVNFGKVMSNLQTGDKNSQYGTIWICNINLKENKRVDKNTDLEDGWEVGRSNWNKIRKCISCSVEFRRPALYCKSCHMKRVDYINKEKIGKHPNQETKDKISNAKKGKYKGKNSSQYDKVWIYSTDLRVNKKIHKSDLCSYINDGWTKGRIGRKTDF